MKQEKLSNFIEFMSKLVENRYYGEIKIRLTNGHIEIGEKADKIKFDNHSFKEYKRNN